MSPAVAPAQPGAVAALAARHPGLEVTLSDAHPPEAIEALRTGKIDVALVFRYDETEPEPPNVRLHHLLDDPLYVLADRPVRELDAHRERALAVLRGVLPVAGA